MNMTLAVELEEQVARFPGPSLYGFVITLNVLVVLMDHLVVLRTVV